MINTQKKRDKKLQMVYVAQEQARISRAQTGISTQTYEQQKAKYLEWCKENNVDSLLS